MALISETGENGKLLKATRHAKILERIQNGEELTIIGLHNEWGVSTKTLQRDFDSLIQLGFPIKRSENKKSFVKSEYKTMNDDSAALIVEMLDSMAKDIGGEFYSKAHRLLNRLENHLNPYYTHIDVEDVTSAFDVIKELEIAIKEKKLLNMNYSRGNKDENYRYEGVKALKILSFNGFWYLLVEHKTYIKKFYIKEINNVDLQDETFKVNPNLNEKIENSINVWFEPEKEPYEVTLYLDPNIVKYFQRKPINKHQKIYLQKDGSAELVIKITDDNEVLPLLRNWLPYMRVMEPESLQVKLNEQLENYLNGIGKIS